MNVSQLTITMLISACILALAYIFTPINLWDHKYDQCVSFYESAQNRRAVSIEVAKAMCLRIASGVKA